MITSLWGHMKESYKDKVRQELCRAVARLIDDVSPELIPDDGVELVYAIPAARTPEDVGSCTLFPGRNHINMDNIEFGRVSAMTSGILTAIRFAPEIRCAGSIKNIDSLTWITDEMLFETSTCDAGAIPPGVSTMDWAVAFCSEQETGVPDILFIKNSLTKVQEARIFGENPGSVATNLIKISQRIIDATH